MFCLGQVSLSGGPYTNHGLQIPLNAISHLTHFCLLQRRLSTPSRWENLAMLPPSEFVALHSGAGTLVVCTFISNACHRVPGGGHLKSYTKDFQVLYS